MREYIEQLSYREKYRDDYLLNRDPIYRDRLFWRAQTFRHLVHRASDAGSEHFRNRLWQIFVYQ